MMRRSLAALFLYLALGPLPGSVKPWPPVNDSRTMTTGIVTGIIPGHRFGALTLAEAWQLRSVNPRFGGFSGLALTGPRRFVMVSDAGLQLRFELDASGTVALRRWGDLPPLRPGNTSKRLLDAEAVSFDARSRNHWVTLEGIDQIWRFDAADRRTARLHSPAMRHWPVNGGPESLAQLADGRFIAISERKIRDDRHEGLIFAGDPTNLRGTEIVFQYDSGEQGSVTDMAALPDGRVLILHRKLGLVPVFSSSIAIADPRRLPRGAVLTSRSIAVIRHGALAENYEGMTVEAAPDGLSLWLVSDDNHNDWQATRLLRFEIDLAALK